MSLDNEQKKKALDAALVQIEKQFGKGAVLRDLLTPSTRSILYMPRISG